MEVARVPNVSRRLNAEVPEIFAFDPSRHLLGPIGWRGRLHGGNAAD